jgi:hypothetical protein
LLVPHGDVRGDTVGVLELRITGNLMMSRSARTCFGGFNQRPPDAMSPQCRFDVPALELPSATATKMMGAWGGSSDLQRRFRLSREVAELVSL